MLRATIILNQITIYTDGAHILNSVPVYDMTLGRISKIAENISLSKGRVLLYHGSKSGIVGEIEPKSRPQCDFGKGFYMGTEVTQDVRE